jgi:tRNA(fMet)-specific endonuclease VapC
MSVWVFPFDKPAISRFNQLRRVHRRIGTNDLRIGAITIEIQATLVTRNTSDFSPISGLLTENWAD